MICQTVLKSAVMLFAGVFLVLVSSVGSATGSAGDNGHADLVATGSDDAAASHDAAASQHAVETRVELSDASVMIAQPFTLTIKVYHRATQRIEFSALPESVGPFAVMSVRDQLDLPITEEKPGPEHDRSVASGWQRESIRRIQVEAWQSGDLEFPAVEFSVFELNSDSESTTEAIDREVGRGLSQVSKPIVVHVFSDRPAGESVEQLRGLAGAQDAQPARARLSGVWWAGGGLVALSAVAIAVWMARRPETQQSMSEWALERLANLRSTGMGGSQVRSDERLSGASVILRDYLNLRFGLNANVGTVSETVSQLRLQGWSPAFVERLERWLTTVEQVSFAGVGMSESEVEGKISQAIGLVEEAESMRPVLDQNDQVEFPANRTDINRTQEIK